MATNKPTTRTRKKNETEGLYMYLSRFARPAQYIVPFFNCATRVPPAPATSQPPTADHGAATIQPAASDPPPSFLPRMQSSLEDFWKDDFGPLKAAGKAIVDAMKEDESDLRPRLGARSTTANSSRFRHVQSFPLRLPRPPTQYQRMGLLIPAQLVWVSLDHELYLYSLEAVLVAHYAVESRQPIATVGVVPPKKGACVCGDDRVGWMFAHYGC